MIDNRGLSVSIYRKEWACCGSVTETEAWEPDMCPFCAPHQDTARLEYLYGGRQTGSNALVDAELRLLSGKTMTLEEARTAVDEAMRTPLVLAVG